MKKIIFFDTTWNQLLRVGNVVAGHIKESADVVAYGLVFETSGKEVHPDNDKHNFNEILVSTKIEEVNTFILDKHPNIVVFAQNTIPDLDAILYSQKVGARIMMMQHGLLYDGATLNNVRIGEIYAALMKAKKTFGYLNILRKMCKVEGISYVKALSEIITAKYNVTTTIQNLFPKPLRGDKAFVIGKHWVNYYCENYGYKTEDVYVMGNHDVDDLDANKEVEDAICYIPSVHVEDGKVQLHVFNNFLSDLASSIPEGKKLYIKLHPRSNKSLYTTYFPEDKVVYITDKNLPYVRIYIGHNSSLLSKALQISGVLVLWGFKEEKELFYRDFAYKVCENRKDIKDSLDYLTANPDYSRKSDIEVFSYKNPEGAYKYCSNKIAEML